MYPANPPGSKLASRLTSGSRNVIYGSCRPVLTVPGPAARLERVLLAYDGSPKAQEGLYVAAYLAGRWGVWLVVTTIIETEADTGKLAEARRYLASHEVTATYVPGQGDVTEAILRIATQQASDLIIIGGYGVRAYREAILGSKVDRILREAKRPVLICR
jgi:nucleotide-binding universal stress UspA family protein